MPSYTVQKEIWCYFSVWIFLQLQVLVMFQKHLEAPALLMFHQEVASQWCRCSLDMADLLLLLLTPASSSSSSSCRYPHCLHMLELLQYEHFRKELVNAQCTKFIDEQQLLHWQHYSRKRTRLQQALAEQQQQATQPPHGNAASKWPHRGRGGDGGGDGGGDEWIIMS